MKYFNCMFMLLMTVALFAGCNQSPNVKASGPDQMVAAGDKVRLRGSASDPDGTIQTYRWEQVEGPSVSISNVNQASASFVAPKVKGYRVLVFRLTVVDDGNATATDRVVVTIVGKLNQPPNVQASSEYGRLGITLSGTVKSHATYRGISGASISVSQYQGETSRMVGTAKANRNGKYTVQVRVNPGRLTVNANAVGFAHQSIIVDVSDGSRRTADLSMIPVQVTQSFRPENNAAIQVDGQTVVSLSANVLVTESGGAASGQATARVTVLDASKDPSVMPGDLESYNADTGEAEPIESFGAMNVEFTGGNGNRLNLESGKQANISIPLASGRRPEDSPQTIPLYYWSDATGYWVEEGEAVLERTADGKWAYTGSVGHFSTWNADVLYESITMKGCVQDQNGRPVKYAEVTARGKDYVGSSSATTDVDGRFEIAVRPDSELELSAAADGPLYSDARSMRTESADDISLSSCLVVTGDQSIQDFPMEITGTTGSLEICVRDHECEDGDKIKVDVEGRTIFSGEIGNDWACHTLEVRAGQSYEVEMTALNGTGYKGNCSYADKNTGEIRVAGENTETQVWRHRGGTGSKAQIVVKEKTVVVEEKTGWKSSAWDKFVAKAKGEKKDGDTSTDKKTAASNSDKQRLRSSDGPAGSLILLIDVSGSMSGTKLRSAKQAAINTIRKAIKNKTEIAILTFEGDCTSPIDGSIGFTRNEKQLTAFVNGLTAQGGTPLATALEVTNRFMKQHKSASSRTQMILLLADGDDDCGNLDSVLSQLKKNNLLYRHETVGLEVSGSAQRQLENIAAQSGGKYHSATSQNLSKVFSDAMDLMKMLDMVGKFR